VGGLTVPPVLQATGLTKVFGARGEEALRLAGEGVGRDEILRRTGSTLAVHDVGFAVERGELFVVMGLSGSGKSTLVRLLNRLIEPSAGTVEVDGQDLRALGDADLRTLRNDKVSMVFQHFALLPHRTVRENAAYALKIRGVPAAEQRERADWALRTVGLLDRADARPDQLSGGMQQRVGLARALAADSEVCSWTSRSPRWTRSSGATCRTCWCSCRPSCRRRSSSSRTTSTRPCGWATAS
jgi:ABC-type proline/glycine betaine transport system, ATPase component